MNMEQSIPLLSITVLNYNYAHYLPQCLDSILCQTWQDFELILINDCSTDNSLQVIEQYLGDPRIRLVNHARNKGFVPSLIEGAELSRGKYITVVSADDFSICPEAFAKLLAPLETDDRVAMSYSAFGQYSADGKFMLTRRPHPASFVRDGAEEFRELVLDPWVLHSGLVIRRSAYGRLGGYDSTFRYAVDLKITLLLCSQGRIAYCADQLFAYRMHQTNMSHDSAAARRNLVEAVDSFKAACIAMRGAPGISDHLCNRAISSHILSMALSDIWAGRVRRGWYFFWCAFRSHPVLTLRQVKALHVLGCAMLGPHNFKALQLTVRRLSRQPLPI